MRGSMGAPIGTSHYCSLESAHQCKEGEGHCSVPGHSGAAGCNFGTFCGAKTGAKYGLPAAASACIPTYDVQQISV